MVYEIYFEKAKDDKFRLPVNPEELKISTSQSNESYNVLNLGEIAKPTGMELRKYSFEAEFPSRQYSYVSKNDFKPAEYYFDRLREWRESNNPIRFVFNNSEGLHASVLVLIESMEITEKAGEEGDYIASFELKEYREFGKKELPRSLAYPIEKAQVPKRVEEAPKPNSYTVTAGDTLWGIAKRYLGDGARYPEIVDINPDISNPSLIYVGQVIRLP